MILTLEEKLSISFWWLVALGITGYLCLGIANTVVVILQ